MDLSNPRVDSQLKEQIIFQNDQLHYGIYDEKAEPQFYGDILWHWHDEFEFGVVTRGSLIYKTNQHEYVLNEGDAVFINSGVLHYLHLLVPAPEARIYTQFFDRSFLAGSAESIFDMKYVTPVIEQKQLDLIPFYHNRKNDRYFLSQLADAARIAQEGKAFYEFRLRNLFSSLWETIYSRATELEAVDMTESMHDIERVKIMLTFIREHYHEKLTVPQIADCIPVSERECYRLFQNNLGMTPTEFLISLRLKKARDLLITTRKSVVEIALESGFGNSSYFGKVFRQEFHMSPGDYRRQNANEWEG